MIVKQQAKQESFWTKQECRYNEQINFVEWAYDFHPEAFRVLDDKTLNAVILFFGVGKYCSGENFLERRKKLVAKDVKIEAIAVTAMRQVAKQLRADESGEIFG